MLPLPCVRKVRRTFVVICMYPSSEMVYFGFSICVFLSLRCISQSAAVYLTIRELTHRDKTSICSAQPVSSHLCVRIERS